MANRLQGESSPYLLQHAENPVDWYPWGEEALARAREENRPILLSIGYSSCHWCHVMERESFEDPETARLMNELFVNIKVDREERPDLDQIYMKAVQAITGGGGWPMTVFLTPQTVPYFGGTYYPPEPRHGMPSFSEVLSAASHAWLERPDEVQQGATRLLEALRRATSAPTDGVVAGEAELDGVHAALRARYDATHGGFGRAPKFPQPPTLETLARHHVRTGDSESLEMLLHTLRRMAAGGMRDHLGGGFHRYSVDARWLVPHFEKMLYDNALLARTYTDAYRLTGSDDLAEVAIGTLEYVLDDLTDPSGAFYSARDADSGGEEGTFYVWRPAEVREVLGGEADLFCRVYDVTESGNFEGSNILHLAHPLEAIASSEGMTVLELEGVLARGRASLLERRAGREAPFRDDKALVSWNAMTLRALAEAGAVFDRPDFVEAARRNADFLCDRMIRDGRLLHTHLEGVSKIPAFLEDHGALCAALVALNGVTLEDRWLETARWLAEEIMARFWDEDAGTVYDTAHDAEELVLRPRDPMDNATPSGPSLAAEALTVLGHVDGVASYTEAAGRIIDHEVEALRQYGPAFGRMLSVLDRRLATPTEIVIVGDRSDPAAWAMIREAHADLERARIVVGSDRTGSAGGPLFEGRLEESDGTTAYVCRDFACRLPVTDSTSLRAELDLLG